MRQTGRSVNEIAQALEVSKGSVSHWVRDVELTNGQKKELKLRQGAGRIFGSIAGKEQAFARRIEYQRQGREMVKNCDREYAMGCMLFWAEGTKARNTVVFTNTDEDMVLFFVSFLKKYFGCRKEDFALRLDAYLDNGMTPQVLEEFWIGKLGLGIECIRKSMFKRGDGNGGKYPHGVCRIYVCSGEIAQKLFGSIQELMGLDREKEWARLR
jgi:hypothetical protein